MASRISRRSDVNDSARSAFWPASTTRVPSPVRRAPIAVTMSFDTLPRSRPCRLAVTTAARCCAMRRISPGPCTTAVWATAPSGTTAPSLRPTSSVARSVTAVRSSARARTRTSSLRSASENCVAASPCTALRTRRDAEVGVSPTLASRSRSKAICTSGSPPRTDDSTSSMPWIPPSACVTCAVTARKVSRSCEYTSTSIGARKVSSDGRLNS